MTLDLKIIRDVARREAIKITATQWLIILLIAALISFASATTITQNRITQTTLDYTVKGTIVDISPLISDVSLASSHDYYGWLNSSNMADGDWDSYGEIVLFDKEDAGTPGGWQYKYSYLFFNISKEVFVDSVYFKYGAWNIEGLTNKTSLLLTSNADTFVESGNPDKNHGGDAPYYERGALWVGNNNGIGYTNFSTGNARILVKFDLTSIPSNATITSATLSMFREANVYETTAAGATSIHRNNADWNENSATWNNKPSLVEPATSSISLGDWTTYGLYYSWDVTSDVQTYVSGSYNYGWTVKTQESSGQVTNFVSREHGCPLSKNWFACPAPPRLSIAYTLPVAGIATAPMSTRVANRIYISGNYSSPLDDEISNAFTSSQTKVDGNEEIIHRLGTRTSSLSGYGSIMNSLQIELTTHCTDYYDCTYSPGNKDINVESYIRFYELKIMGYELD